jgi:hypothetical protein
MTVPGGLKKSWWAAISAWTVLTPMTPQRSTRAALRGVIVEARQALEAREVILPVRLYDMDELRRFRGRWRSSRKNYGENDKRVTKCLAQYDRIEI